MISVKAMKHMVTILAFSDGLGRVAMVMSIRKLQDTMRL